MFVCTKCGTYTLKRVHCGAPTVSAHPPPFNPNDWYGEYRRRFKKIKKAMEES